MPDLPTLTVTSAQATRMLAAFAPKPDATQAETAAAYKEWLRQQILQKVIAFEVAQVQADVTKAARDKKAEIVAAMPAPPPPAVTPIEPAPVLPAP